MNIFFTSDWHLDHANILKYCGRTQFMTQEDLSIYNKLTTQTSCERDWKSFIVSKESVENMNSEIIRRCNERVKEEDMLIHNGDFEFRSGSKRGEGELHKPKDFLSQIKCKNVIFIRGNHDAQNSVKTPILSLTLQLGGMFIYVVHNPEFCSPAHGLNLTGHVHNAWACNQIRKGEHLVDCVNVSCDVWNFYPVDINEILQRYTQWKKTK